MKKKNEISAEFIESDIKKPHKWRSRFAKVGTGLLAMIAGLATTYFLVPNRVKNIDLGMPDEPEPAEETYFSRFVSKLTPMISGETVDEAFGLKASFDDFSIEWPNNRIDLNGEINLNMKGITDFEFTIDLEVGYGSHTIDAGIGFADSSLYVIADDLKLKTSFMLFSEAGQELEDLILHIKDLYFNPANDEGMQISLQLDQVLAGLIGSAGDMDLGALTSGAGLNVIETEDENFAYCKLDIALGETSLGIELVINKETISLERVDLGTMNFGNVTIKGALDCESRSNLKVYGFDNENYTFKKRDGFVSILNYKSWVDDIFRLLKTRTVGLDINATLVDAEHSYGFVDCAVDLDASRFRPLDIAGTIINSDLFGLTKSPSKTTKEIEPQPVKEENEVLSVLNNFNFNVDLKLGNYKVIDNVLQKVDYSNLNLAYFKNSDEINAGYLTLNESEDKAVMKAQIDVDTINFIISEVPNIVNSITGGGAPTTETNALTEGLFDFITSSDVVTAIQKGKYDTILDLLDFIKSTENTIEISINLAPLGFSEDAKVKLVLDATNEDDAPSKVININLEKVDFAGLELNASINTRPFNVASINGIDQTRETFDKLDFVPGALNQVEKILDTKQTGFKVSGSAFDASQLGFKFDGWGQLDYGQNVGFGSIQFDEYKYLNKGPQKPHIVDISIDNRDGDHAKNDMLFEYRETLKGKFTLKTFDDIIDLVLTLANEQSDNRFTRYLTPIMSELTGSVIMESIGEKDYLALSQPSYLKSVKQINEGSSIQIVIAKELLMDFLPSDLVIRINLKEDSTLGKCLDSVELVGIQALGKTIDVKISLADFDVEKENPVDLQGNFLDFSDIAVLLEFGINTTKLDHYYLTAKAKVTIGDESSLIQFPLDQINLDFHVVVLEDGVKVYGSMAKSPIPGLTSSTEFVFKPSDDSNDQIGGNFYILRKDRPVLLELLVYDRQDVLYVTDSSNFLDNILTYLLEGFLGIPQAIVTSISNLIDTSKKEETDPNYENIFTDTGFVYTANETKNTYTWKTGISIEAFTEKNTINPIEATITGSKLDGVGYLNTIHAATSISIIGLVADINLVNPDPSEHDWPSSIETAYQSVINYYNGDISSIMNNVHGYKVAK